MTAPFKPPASADLPYWPFDCLSLYVQMARDFGSYAHTLSRCTDAMEAIRAEGVLGMRLVDGLTRAYADLAVLPWTAMTSALARQQGAQGSGLPEADGRPLGQGRPAGHRRADGGVVRR